MNKKQIIVSSLCLLTGAAFTACDDLFEPANENSLTIDEMLENPYYADNFLGNCYSMIPNGSAPGENPTNDVATSDAVTNKADNAWRRITENAWKSDNDPSGRWRECRAGIQLVNMFLGKCESVNWAKDEIIAQLFMDRELGEAYALRAMFTYYLLEAHAGMVGTELMGVPLLTEPETVASDFNVGRSTFNECIAQINADVEKALTYLPDDYVKTPNNYRGEANDLVPAKYKEMFAGITNAQYMRVFDSNFEGRMSGRIAKAIRAKAYLLAASKAFAASGEKMDKAADYFGELVDFKYAQSGGLDPNGLNCWYGEEHKAAIEAIATVPQDEMLWRTSTSESNQVETQNYPYSLNGNGQINPTQNLVDAFYASNGYPINHAKANYDAKNPYENRDKRLAMYVVTDGSKLSVSNAVINIADDTDSKDKIGVEATRSTRTGYYLRKWIREDAVYDQAANAISTQKRYSPRIRYTEIFLSYAEAANDAWGPKGKGNHALSAYDVIKMIRERAGFTGVDGYLDECAASKEAMAELIKNERRLELCFEGIRFWDLRRWADGKFMEKPQGVRINRAAKTYTKFDIETTPYKDYMYYGPIPYSEILKYSELKQNTGW